MRRLVGTMMPSTSLVVGGVVEAGSAVKNVDRVVVPAQQAVGAEAGDLFARVAFDGVGEGDFQPPPGFARRPGSAGSLPVLKSCRRR